MKGKIMLQRFVVVTQTILAVCCLGALGLMWQMMRQNQQVNLVFQERLAELVLKSNPAAMEWTSFQVKCLQGTEQGAPAENVQLQLSAKGTSEFNSVSVARTTSEDGVVKFGPLRVGNYELVAKDSFGRWNKRWIALYPGVLTEETVVCPEGEPKSAKVEIEIVPSDAFKEVKDPAMLGMTKDSMAVFAFRFKHEGTEIAGKRWLPPGSPYRSSLLPAVQYDLWVTLDGRVVSTQSKQITGMPEPLVLSRTLLNSAKVTAKDLPRSMTLPVGDYTLINMEAQGVRTDSRSNLGGVHFTMPTVSQFEEPVSFQVSSNQVNRWRIDLPDLEQRPRAMSVRR